MWGDTLHNLVRIMIRRFVGIITFTQLDPSTLKTKTMSYIHGTPPPESAEPKKLCTANFSPGTLKTLINRLTRLTYNCAHLRSTI